MLAKFREEFQQTEEKICDSTYFMMVMVVHFINVVFV